MLFARNCRWSCLSSSQIIDNIVNNGVSVRGPEGLSNIPDLDSAAALPILFNLALFFLLVACVFWFVVLFFSFVFFKHTGRSKSKHNVKNGLTV